MSQVALIIIYNHRYDENIPRLENLYSSRFSSIYHLVPFYDGNKENVIPVFENSYYFQGYIAQGYKQFYKEEFKHYLFIGDDLILNPVITENNYQEHLSLSINSSFFTEFIDLRIKDKNWPRVQEAYQYERNIIGVELGSALPSYSVALKKVNELGFDFFTTTIGERLHEPIIKKNSGRFDYLQSLLSLLQFKRTKNQVINMQYPLIGGYSDIFVVASSSIQDFVKYCGAFAVTKLFVEVAIPTALVLACNDIKTEKDILLHGRALWSKEELMSLDKYENNLTNLMENFPANNLYLHPVKLSKWK